MTHNTESDSATTADTAASANTSAAPAPDQLPVPNGVPDHETQPRAPHPVTKPGRAAIDRGDVTISAALLIIFIAAFVNAQQWEAIAALFPKLATGIGAVLSGAFLVRSLVGKRQTAESTPERKPETTEPSAATDESAELGADQAESERAFFASLSLRDWLVSLACFAAFFISLYALGLYVTSLLFTIGYLKFQARSSSRFSVIYAIVLTAALYGLFGYALKLPVPEGLFGLSGL
jgi:xanthine/uracil permease